MYGKPSGPLSDQEWSIAFDNENFNQFLFATGDCTKWLIADKDVVTGCWYANDERMIYKSSMNPNRHTAKWYRREGNIEDPWISLTDHHQAIGAGDIVYGEDGYGGTHANTVLPICNGANVYIRMKGKFPAITQPSGFFYRFSIHDRALLGPVSG